MHFCLVLKSIIYRSDNLHLHSIHFFFSFLFLFFVFHFRILRRELHRINRRALISFLPLFDNAALEANINSFELPVKSVLEWNATAKVPDAKEIIESRNIEVGQGKSALEMSQLLTNSSPPFRKLGTGQVCQILRA